MDEHRKERITGLGFATDCLRDDVGRLERLSSQLSDKSQREECSDIAHNISSQLGYGSVMRLPSFSRANRKRPKEQLDALREENTIFHPASYMFSLIDRNFLR